MSLRSTPALPLARLLGHAADAVQAVRAGQSLDAALARVPAEARPGAQALAFHALRWLGSALGARAHLAPKAPPPATDALLLTALALLWPRGQPPYAAHTLVDQAVQAARAREARSAGFVNAVLRRFLRETDAVVAAAERDPVAVHNHPVWWAERLARDWPDRWEALLAAANRRPPMTLRVNARRGDAAAYLERLRAAGLDGTAFGAATVVLATPCPVGQLPGFAEGDVSVQDAGAQLAAPLLLNVGLAERARPDSGPSAGTAAGSAATGTATGPAATGTATGPAATGTATGPAATGAAAESAATGSPVGTAAGSVIGRAAVASAPWRLPPRARVLDACAAPGGKTAHLLELADLDVLALDSDPARLTRVDETLRRLHLAARTRAADAGDPAAWWDGRPFDAILLDAPCTASGIVRRHPDVRWLRRPGDIATLARTQARLLDALWPTLAPGGRLLYCTCSVFRAEGEGQIDAFLQRRADATRVTDPAAPGHLLPLPDNGAQALAPAAGASPDGFYYALLQKT